MGGTRWNRQNLTTYHCRTEQEAAALKSILTQRFKQCGLQMHPDKTKIIYCKSWKHKADYAGISFDFLGFTFRPRLIKTRQGRELVCFLPSISQKAAKRIRTEINEWAWLKWQQGDIKDIIRFSQSKLRGWMEYYGKFGRSVITNVLFHFDKKLSRWAKRKYKKLKTLIQAAKRVNAFRRRNRLLLAHWNRVCVLGWMIRAGWSESFTSGSVRALRGGSLRLLDHSGRWTQSLDAKIIA